jgi:uncharacterized metal-binding protein
LKCASCTKKDCFNGKDCLENREEIKELYREGESDYSKHHLLSKLDTTWRKPVLKRLFSFQRR